jgi:hypothetical protein
MNRPFNIHIVSCGEIKTSMIGKMYRRVILEDIENNKTVEYVLFSNTHKFMWIDTL